MNSVSTLTYYSKILWAYGTYYLSTFVSIFRDFPYEVKVAVSVIIFSLVMMAAFLLRLLYLHRRRRRLRKLEERLEKKYGDAIDYVFSAEESEKVTQGKISERFYRDTKDTGKPLLSDRRERRMFSQMLYQRLISDVADETQFANLHILLDMFSIPSFLESEVSLSRMSLKVQAMDMLRAFKLYISPWVINKLLNDDSVRVRRLAMYSSIISSSDSDLDYFETDFFNDNCCIKDEIELGYVLQRRNAAGLKLPNLAHWANLQKNDNTRCMFVRLMRRFDQREYCEQLVGLFKDSKHKKLIEEISRTWGYLHYLGGESMLSSTMLTQPDDTKVAIMHAVTRMATGQSLNLLYDGYANTTNPHVRFEALRCLYNYGDAGRALLQELEESATESEQKYFSFFHNDITIARLRLDREQAYHPSVETVYNQSNF